ncbi:TonB-dependent receptor [candidate division KSB1 bacterium]|nr:TonB-dependent receptor [candidate division KSB1 bacterium]
MLFLIMCSSFLFAQETEDLMDMSLDDLLNMDVTTASKSAEKLSDAPGIISVLSNDELERFGGTTLRDILERVPGLISSGANYTNRTTIAPRGDQIKQNSSHVLLLINGRPIREVQEGGVSSDVLESFPVDVIEKIEVIKGPGSVLYGSDAFSAVINIITKTPEKTGLSVTALSEGGEGYEASANVSLVKGDLSVIAAGRIFEKSEWETTMKSVVGQDTVTLAPIIATTDVSIPNKGPGAYLGVNYKNLRLMSSFQQWTTQYVSTGAFAKVELNKLFTNIGYSHKFSESWDSDFNITYVQAALRGQNLSDRDCYNFVAEWTNSLTIGDKIGLVVGGLFNKNSGDEKSQFDGLEMMGIFRGDVISTGDLNSFAFYSQIDYQLIENLKLIAGIQANKVENIDLDIVPRGGAIWYPLKKVNVKALYSEAFRAPSINELNMAFGGILSGNPDLKPEKVSTIDVSVGYQGEQTQLNVNFFRSNMTDITQIVYDPVVFSGQYQNNQDAVFTGYELEGKYYVNKSLYLTGSVIQQTSENDDVKNLSPVADFGAKAGISYVTSNGISVGLFNIYQGDLDDKFQGNINDNQGAYNLMHFHSTINLNKLLNWGMSQNLTAIFKIDNVLDKEHFGYDLGGTSGDGIPSFPGRAIYVGLKASL